MHAVADLVAAGGAAVTGRGATTDRAATAGEVELLARRLRDAGVGDGVPVGVAIVPSRLLFVAMLAVLRSGGAVVPLDPSYPAARLALMAGAAGLELVLCDEAGAAALAGVGTLARCRLDRPWTAPAAVRTPPPGLDGCAYVLFTSGSTGVPKGVAMPGEAIARLVAWQVAAHPIGGAGRTLQFAPSGFDVCFQELLCTWDEGGTLVVPEPGDRRDGFKLARCLARERVTRAFLPFVALQQLAVAWTTAGHALPELRQVFTAGEQPKATGSLRELFGTHPEARLFNQYGPTETHVVTELALGSDPDAWDDLPAIGRPLPHVEVRVEPPDEGELLVGGPCVARGYLGQPELTAERFLTDARGVRWYRTGDLVRLRDDGDLQYLGRIDEQVKVRGFRVELGEVEAVLGTHPHVAAAVAFVHEAAGGGRTLAAAVQPREGRAVDPAALRDHARRLVPEHLVPGRIDVVGALPRTPSGKTDRRALGDRATLVERLVLETVAAEVGGPIAAGDAMLDVGADSLTAMVVVGRLRAELGVEVTVEDVLDAESIGALARAVADGR